VILASTGLYDRSIEPLLIVKGFDKGNRGVFFGSWEGRAVLHEKATPCLLLLSLVHGANWPAFGILFDQAVGKEHLSLIFYCQPFPIARQC
jgi:hypothetical protein